MPLNLTAEDRKLLLIGGGILLVIVIAALLLAPPEEAASEVPSTYSAASAGAKAAYLLLAESGYNVQRWEESPTLLPAGRGVTLIIAGPTELPNKEERASLRTFVTGGGRLIATGSLAATLLPDEKAISDPIPATAWFQYSALAPSLAARVAPQISMSAQGHWNAKPPVVALYGTDDKAVVVEYKYGEGEIVWWAGATPLTNAGLKETGNLEFFLASLASPQDTRILWDEYFHGYRHSLTATMAHTQMRWMTIQLLLLAVFVLLTFSRRSGPVRAVHTETRLSPLEFVDTLGGLYERAGAAAVAVEIYYQRFRYWLTRRLGVASNATIPELEGHVRDRWHFRDSSFGAILARCESARFDHDLSAREALKLVQALHDFAARLEVFPAPKQEKP